VRCVLYFALSLPTDTAIPLSHEDVLLRGNNCTRQLNIERIVVAVEEKGRQELRQVIKFYWYWIFFLQTDTKSFYLPHNPLSARAMIFPIFTFLSLISSTVHGSLQIIDRDYTLMHFTKLISEENFTAGHPLVIVLPIEEKYQRIRKWDIWLRNYIHQNA